MTLRDTIPYVYAIRTKKQAKLMAEHTSENIRKHCQKILDGESIIRRVKEFHLGQILTVKDFEFVLVEFPNRTTVRFIDTLLNDDDLQEMKITELRKELKNDKIESTSKQED